MKQGMWGLSAGVVAGAGGYWYLSYVYLSWDIMVRGRQHGRAWFVVHVQKDVYDHEGYGLLLVRK